MRKINLFILTKYLINFKKGKRVRIFWLRGGLGNQIFQIFGIAYLYQKLDFDLILNDYDVTKNPRDKGGASCFNLNIDALIAEKNSVFKADWGVKLIARMLDSKFCKNRFGARNNLDVNLTDNGKTIAQVYGYLQNLKYVQAFSANSIREFFQITENRKYISNSVAMHIRATDGLVKEEKILSISYYKRALEYFSTGQIQTIHIYSDDIKYARKVCAELGNHNFEFPEEIETLEPLQLLYQLSSYTRLVGSKSTLCWWASYISLLQNPKAKIISPWDSTFSLENWIQITD